MAGLELDKRLEMHKDDITRGTSLAVSYQSQLLNSLYTPLLSRPLPLLCQPTSRYVAQFGGHPPRRLEGCWRTDREGQGEIRARQWTPSGALFSKIPQEISA